MLFSKDAIKAVAVNGNYGVTMFFAISGYLITSTAIKRYGRLADVNLPRFYSEPVNAWLRAAFLRAPLPPAAVRP
ncbi:MAG: yrhL [Collimonas fungivorans]|nr:hypothetical protein [Collimonas fungivorans]MDB5767214.1 yrhL [Collimonas fungivorans]